MYGSTDSRFVPISVEEDISAGAIEGSEEEEIVEELDVCVNDLMVWDPFDVVAEIEISSL